MAGVKGGEQVSGGEKTEALAVKEVIYFKSFGSNSEFYRIAVQVAKAAG